MMEIIDDESNYLVAKVVRGMQRDKIMWPPCPNQQKEKKELQQTLLVRAKWRDNEHSHPRVRSCRWPLTGEVMHVRWELCTKPYAGQQGGDTCMCNAGHHCDRAVFQLGKANDTEPTETHGDVNDLNSEPITLIPWLLTRIVQEQDLNSQGWKGKEHHGTSGLESAADLQISWYTSLMRWLITNY